MFVWVGINVEEQLKETRMAVDGVFEKIAISNVTCQLPLHISLKISFNIENELFESALKDIESIYQTQKPFEIDIKGIEKHENIMWIRMYSNAEIEELATKLNLMLKEKYNIPLHEYDLDFIFHTTLFMDDDAEKINIAHNLLGDLALPQTLMANRFVIGTSETGENGTYKVYKTIEVII
jgi:2'-5' RNA ligase